jgi:hypothetical protein
MKSDPSLKFSLPVRMSILSVEFYVVCHMDMFPMFPVLFAVLFSLILEAVSLKD